MAEEIRPAVPPNYDSRNCSVCKESRPASEFRRAKNGTRAGAQCRRCRSTYNRRYYHENDRTEITQRATAALVRRNTETVCDYLLAHPCVDCGEDDPLVLDFDHVRGLKEFNVSFSVKGGYSLNRIMREIEKCEVRCANCHRRRTNERSLRAKVLAERREAHRGR